MITSDEMQQRLLAELEEAHFDNVFSLLNTVIAPSGSEMELAIMVQATLGLVVDGKLAIGTQGFYPMNEQILPKDEAIPFAEGLANWFRFDFDARMWTLARGDMRQERYPFVRLTKSGLAASHEILGSRGYQWWKQPRR